MISGGIVTTPEVSAQCQYLPPGGFGLLYTNDASLATALGCPVGAPPVTASVESASQTYEHGAMAWINVSSGVIFVLFDDGTFQRFDDTYNDAVDPVSGGEIPPAGLTEPVRGFGKVWRSNEAVRSRLGWATTGEGGGTAITQDFAHGQMLYLPSRADILVLIFEGASVTSGTWQSFPGRF